jgi:hypothetical protein
LEDAPHQPDAVYRRCCRRDFGFARQRNRTDHLRSGWSIDYLERFEAARISGEPIIIDGACLSACTLAIGLLPRRQVCATPKAVLGFHAAWRRTPNGGQVTSPLATQVMYELYPANVRKWIARHGGLSGRLILLKGRELAKASTVHCAEYLSPVVRVSP